MNSRLRSLLLLSAVAGVFAARVDAQQTAPPTPAATAQVATTPVIRWTGEGYRLAWSDDFSAPKLDTERWQYRTDSKHWSTQKPENVTLRDGMLFLNVRKEKSGDKEYTGAGVISRKTFKYGYYECRFKTPPGAGWHSSFWMQFYDGSGGTSPSKAVQELDVIENDSVNPNGYGINIHQWNASPAKHLGHKGIKSTNLSADFHTFGCEFTPTVVRFFLDGVQVHSVDATRFEHGEQHIWLTTIASYLGNTKAVDDTQLPSAAIYDYVRFYEKVSD